jgi:hypothetical protein
VGTRTRRIPRHIDIFVLGCFGVCVCSLHGDIGHYTYGVPPALWIMQDRSCKKQRLGNGATFRRRRRRGQLAGSQRDHRRRAGIRAGGSLAAEPMIVRAVCKLRRDPIRMGLIASVRGAGGRPWQIGRHLEKCRRAIWQGLKGAFCLRRRPIRRQAGKSIILR